MFENIISKNKSLLFISSVLLAYLLGSANSLGFFESDSSKEKLKRLKPSCKNKIKPLSVKNRKLKLPIVGGSKYNISLFGVEKLHPFDSAKYGNVQKYLMNEIGICKKNFTNPNMVTDDELLLVHTQAYLDSLKNSQKIQAIAEVPGIGWVPHLILKRHLLKPMKLATGGTIQAAQLALQHGWAINLGGGYHHAKSNSGGGFCFYADIPIAIKKLWTVNPDLKIMIIDLDAHQGNGHESVLAGDDRVTIFDMYNKNIYPRDFLAKRHITFDVPVSSGISGDAYIKILRSELNKALNRLEKKNQKPDLIIFNAGTDILAGDSLGWMNVSAQKVIERDNFVFEQAKSRKIPIVYLFSGGYTKKSANVIGQSLKNILENHLGIKKGIIVYEIPELYETLFYVSCVALAILVAYWLKKTK